MIFVIEKQQKIVATLTLLIERKLINNMGLIAHIEDVVTSTEIRGQGAGKQLIQYAITYAKNLGCYKTILECNTYNLQFYENNGFSKSGSMMVMYH
jgi:glucosamine-phosphate N-acetyltransferase